MKLVQWNIWYKEDALNVLQTLKQVDADVICLQELTVNHPEQNPGIDVPHFIAQGLGFECFFAPVFEKGEQKFGNAIFSRFPMAERGSQFIQDPPGLNEKTDYSREGRIYLEASVQTPEGVFGIGTVHMSYTDRFLPTPAKKAETDNLLEILKTKKGKFVFSGDLNSLPDSYTIQEISKFLQNVGPQLEEKTWTTKPFFYKGFEADTLDWRLDYCFATPDIKVKSARIIQTQHSDHLPILIEF